MSAFTAEHKAETFGSVLPWAEPSWYELPADVILKDLTGCRHSRPSPYYDDSHRHLRNTVRKWVQDVSFLRITAWIVY